MNCMNFLLRRFLSLAMSLLPIALGKALDFAALKKKAEDGDRVAQFQVGMINDSGKEGVEETVKSGSWDLKILNSENAAMLRYAFECSRVPIYTKTAMRRSCGIERHRNRICSLPKLR